MVADEVKTLENSLAVITTSLNTAHDDIADLKQANAQLAKEIAMLKEASIRRMSIPLSIVPRLMCKTYLVSRGHTPIYCLMLNI
jgi:septal ring factor EnvC (AmiA/AmiB activator)